MEQTPIFKPVQFMGQTIQTQKMFQDGVKRILMSLIDQTVFSDHSHFEFMRCLLDMHPRLDKGLIGKILCFKILPQKLLGKIVSAQTIVVGYDGVEHVFSWNTCTKKKK